MNRSTTKFLLAVSGLLVSSFTAIAAIAEPEHLRPSPERPLPPFEPGPVIEESTTSQDDVVKDSQKRRKVRKGRAATRKPIASRGHHDKEHSKRLLGRLVDELHRVNQELHKVHREKLRDMRSSRHKT